MALRFFHRQASSLSCSMRGAKDESRGDAPSSREFSYTVPRARRELTFFRNALEYRYVRYFTVARCGPTL